MNKAVLRSASFILAIVLTLGSFVSGQAISETPTVMPNRTVNLAYFFKPPSNSDAVTIAGFGSVVLTAGDEQFRDQLVANGFSSTIPQYVRSEAIMDPGDCTSTPYKNQIAFKAGDFCDISRNHPDWFLLDTNGNRIRVGGSNYYRMDPGSAGWRQFFVTRLVEMQQQRGWSGLFLDNLEAGLNQIQLDGATSPRYPDHASYRAAIRGFLQYLQQNYSQVYNRPIMANIIARSITDETTWMEYVQYMNGGLTERWAVDWRETNYLSESNWLADLALAERTQSQGKYIVLVSRGYATDTNRQKFAFASYLLISNGKASFRYATRDYRQVLLYDNYRVQLGTPRGARYQVGTTWRRDFTNGYVIVDPINHTATISTTPPVTPTFTTVSTRAATFTATPVPTQPAALTPTATFVPTQSATAVSGTITYNDQDPAFSYSSGWSDLTDARAYNGQIKRTTTVGSSVTFSFTGERFSIFYKSGSLYGIMEVYVDGVLVHTLNQNTSSSVYQQRWSYVGTLSPGTHQLRLVYSSGPADGRITLDAVSIP